MKKRTIVSLICCLLTFCVLTGCGKTANDDSKNNNIIIKETEGIEVKAYISSGKNQLIVSAINKTGKMIGSGYIKVSYYDENNNKITVYGTDDTRYNMFENGNEIVYGFELPAENNFDYYIPAKTEVEITIDEEYQEKYANVIDNYVDNFSYSYDINDDNSITLTLNNNGSKSEFAPRIISVVFYKGNKPVYSRDVHFIFKNVEAGKTVSSKFDIPSDYEKSVEADSDVLIDYDSIKIFRIVEGIS